MRITTLFAALAISVASPLAAQTPAPTPAAAPAPAPDRYAAAKEVIGLILPEAQREQMMRSIMASSMAGMSNAVSKGLEGQPLNDTQRQIVKQFIEQQAQSAQDMTIEMLPALLDAMAKAYARQFTLAELRDFKTFFMTPSGQAYIAKAPLMMADPDVAAVQADVMQKSMTRMIAQMGELKEMLKKGGK